MSMVTPMILPGILRECLEEVLRKAAWGPPNPMGTKEAIHDEHVITSKIDPRESDRFTSLQ